MFLKSVFQNKIFIKVLFFLLVLSAVFSLIYSVNINKHRVIVPGFRPWESDININAQIDKKFNSELAFFADSKNIPIGKLYANDDHNYYCLANFPLNKLYFIASNNAFNAINNITVVIGNNLYYYTKEDMAQFKKSQGGFYFLPDEIKYSKNSKYVTDFGILHKFFVGFLSIFYSFEHYLIPVLLLALAFWVYAANKQNFSFNFNLFKNNAIWFVLILGLIIRIDLFNIPFWGDELYTAIMAGNPEAPFIATFSDPGNPPLFFILARFWMILFGNGEVVCRIMPLIFSMLGIFVIYIFVKRNYNKSCALIASFLFTINIYSISCAREFRVYSLCMLLTALGAFYLFEIIKNNGAKTKDFVYYGLIAALMANSHYFLTLILVSNFVFGLFYLNSKARLKLFYANLFGALCLFPYFLYTGLSEGLLSETFNAAIEVVPFKRMFVWISAQFFNPVIVIICAFIFIILFISKNKFLLKDNKYKTLFVYSFYTIIMLFFFSAAFSILIKPITRSYYFAIIAPLVSIVMALALYLPVKNKKAKIIWIIFISMFTIFNYSRLICYIDKSLVTLYKINNLINFYSYDSKQYIKQGKTPAIMIFDIKGYASYYKDKISPRTIIESYSIDKERDFLARVRKLDAEPVYALLNAIVFKNFINELEPYYNLSFIVISENSIVAKLMKKKR